MSARSLLLPALVAALAGVCVCTRQLFEGDACSEDGVCMRLRHCPALVRLLQEGGDPPRCGFAGFDVIVCCPGQQRDDTATRLARPSTAACRNYQSLSNEIPKLFILNGKEAAEKEFPHMAALGYVQRDSEQLSWLCGGSLISEQFVLTAAHCCTNRIWKAPSAVQLGSAWLGSAAPALAEGRYGVSRALVHPGFRRPAFYHDVALLRLEQRVAFSEAVLPACLHAEPQPPQWPLTVAGWGATDRAGIKSSAKLLKTDIVTLPLERCEKYYQRKFPQGLNSSIICAGDPEGKSDTCAGDSGGPLQVRMDSAFTVVGITSLGPSPCGGSVPGVYTSVAQYLDWIEGHVWGPGRRS